MVNLLLNVSFGILILMPQGWLFMILIMLLESFISSELLCKRKFDGRITATVFFANFVSGLFGIIITLILNGPMNLRVLLYTTSLLLSCLWL